MVRRHQRLTSGDRRDHPRDVHRDDSRGIAHCPCQRPGPSDGHVQTGRDHLPSIPQRTAPHRDGAPPTWHRRRVAESNNLRATGTVCRPDTNNHQPKYNRVLDLQAELEAL